MLEDLTMSSPCEVLSPDLCAGTVASVTLSTFIFLLFKDDQTYRLLST